MENVKNEPNWVPRGGKGRKPLAVTLSVLRGQYNLLHMLSARRVSSSNTVITATLESFAGP